MKSLPSKYIVRLGKFVWTTMWQIMMSQLAPANKSGEYIRPDSQFRTTTVEAATGRYRLFVGMGCPWAHRTLVVRVLKGLEDAIAVSLVYPSSSEGIWLLQSPYKGCNTVPELYQLAQPGYQGRCTVPILWDEQTNTIVNNESAEIIKILNSQFDEFTTNRDVNLYPDALQEQCDRWNERIYHRVNNGVYRCGFAQTQAAYEQACKELFTTLDEIDEFLSSDRYLCGNTVTLADVRLFTTLVRFDTVYYGLFKCSIRRIQDYTYLSEYLKDLYQLPGVAKTCDPDSVKQDYYGNLFPLNPGGIIPLGSNIEELNKPHNRQ